jgi:hypothetical protein
MREVRKKIKQEDVDSLISIALDKSVLAVKELILSIDPSYPELFIYENMKKRLQQLLGVG